MRPDNAGPSASPNPPASSAGDRPRGSSSSASGLPRVSATIRSRTRSSSGPVPRPPAAPAHHGRPARRRRAPRSPSRCRSPAGSRTAKTSPTDSTPRRRATKASACAEAAVEPLRVVHDRDERPLLRHVGQQAQDRQADEEAIRGVAAAQAERGAERVALRSRQALQAIHERRAELLQPGERELHLGLDARRAGDGAPRRAPHQVSEQRALADPGLAAQHERPARARPDARHQLHPAPRTRCAGRAAVARDRESTWPLAEATGGPASWQPGVADQGLSRARRAGERSSLDATPRQARQVLKGDPQ